MNLDQKKYVVQAMTNDFGIPQGEMWLFMLSYGGEDEKNAYEDQADAQEDIKSFSKRRWIKRS